MSPSHFSCSLLAVYRQTFFLFVCWRMPSVHAQRAKSLQVGQDEPTSVRFGANSADGTCHQTSSGQGGGSGGGVLTGRVCRTKQPLFTVDQRQENRITAELQVSEGNLSSLPVGPSSCIMSVGASRGMHYVARRCQNKLIAV